ncbi:lytic polysaccharide monooxygenase [Tahibacter harae]|uniref:Lytic polysaccharide monooxygenase n=1 Tax=Tahibacter harae TaxID=2963937 RepID=A0ABT1QYF0_9GAMM|nr:lytic polysaccharide monooxygenase [Tahibacter harae]
MPIFRLSVFRRMRCLPLFATAPALLAPAALQAHGSMTTPPSRIYTCYLNGAENRPIRPASR